jgi:hypothetical protein
VSDEVKALIAGAVLFCASAAVAVWLELRAGR